MLRDTDIGEILVQADDLQHRVRELGAQISQDYADRDLLLIGVLKGLYDLGMPLLRVERVEVVDEEQVDSVTC